MKRFEIFRPGRHTAASGVTLNFSEADLQAAVDAYDPKVHEAPIVVGHPKDNAPAYGWIGSLSFGEAGAMEAAPIQVDADFAEMVSAGRFKKRSASWYVPGAANHPLAGKAGHDAYYLRHVAFLGAQPPAVKGLRDVSFSEEEGVVEFSDTSRWAWGSLASLLRGFREWVIGEKGVEAADKAVPNYLITDIERAAEEARATTDTPGMAPAFGEHNVDVDQAISWLKKAIRLHQAHMDGKAPTTGKDGAKSQQELMDQIEAALAALTKQPTMDMNEGADMPTVQELQTQMNAAQAQIAALQKTQMPADFAERETALAAREAAVTTAEAKLARAAIEARVDAIVKAGRLLPKQKQHTVDFAMSLADGEAVIDFGEGDKAKKVTQREAYLLQLEGAAKVVEFDELAGHDNGPKDPKDELSFAEAQKTLSTQVFGAGKA